MNFNIQHLLKILNSKAPFKNSENWDNTGLIIGSRKSYVEKIFICVSLNAETLDEALKKGCDTIITHHPPIFNKINKIIKEDNNIIFNLIKNNLNVISLHTNFDIEFCRDFLPDCLKNLSHNLKTLSVVSKETLYKMAVFVPKKYVEKVRSSMFEAGAGSIGEYSNCSYNSDGYGTFLPEDNTNPHIGKPGKLEKVEEIKVETICSEIFLDKVKNSMISSHPYEEVAYDIYELKQTGRKKGYGLCGSFNERVKLNNLYLILKKEFPFLRVSGNAEKQLKKFAFCNGAGASFIDKVISYGADVFITSDVKFHEAFDASQKGLSIIDIGHFESEESFSKIIKQKMELELKQFNVNLILSADEKGVFWS
ncbi:MAG: Nif3-like dinuclear metal center hexameric protein [Candidatus Muiribacteriota bacterium]